MPSDPLDPIDPDEPFSLDVPEDDPEDALRRLLGGAGTSQPISDDAAESLYGLVEDVPEPPDTEADSGVLGGVDEPNEALDEVRADEEPLE